jgi:hypothetical protein
MSDLAVMSVPPAVQEEYDHLGFVQARIMHKALSFRNIPCALFGSAAPRKSWLSLAALAVQGVVIRGQTATLHQQEDQLDGPQV